MVAGRPNIIQCYSMSSSLGQHVNTVLAMKTCWVGLDKGWSPETQDLLPISASPAAAAPAGGANPKLII